MQSYEKPKFFRIMKIIGCIGVVLLLIGIVFTVLGFTATGATGNSSSRSDFVWISGDSSFYSDFDKIADSGSFSDFNGFKQQAKSSFAYSAIGMVLMFIGGSMALVGFSVGFSPELARLRVRTGRYIQNENKEDLKDIADTSADIVGDALSSVARSIHNGIKGETVYCKNCGKEIAADSKFCRFCGEQQDF